MNEQLNRDLIKFFEQAQLGDLNQEFPGQKVVLVDVLNMVQNPDFFRVIEEGSDLSPLLSRLQTLIRSYLGSEDTPLSLVTTMFKNELITMMIDVFYELSVVMEPRDITFVLVVGLVNVGEQRIEIVYDGWDELFNANTGKTYSFINPSEQPVLELRRNLYVIFAYGTLSYDRQRRRVVNEIDDWILANLLHAMQERALYLSRDNYDFVSQQIPEWEDISRSHRAVIFSRGNLGPQEQWDVIPGYSSSGFNIFRFR